MTLQRERPCVKKKRRECAGREMFYIINRRAHRPNRATVTVFFYSLPFRVRVKAPAPRRLGHAPLALAARFSRQ
jgi:hypothetical protein